MSKFYACSIFANPRLQQELIPILDNLGSTGFEQTDQKVIAYIPYNAISEEDLKQKIGFHVDASSVSIDILEPQNWNAVWEANFAPILIPNTVYIRAEFHDKTDTDIPEIIIVPKMAFGTGHHETTYMMLERMASYASFPDHVFDYGAGTGILSVFAAMRGAKHIVANDIQAEAIPNIREHFDCNAIPLIPETIHGDINHVPEDVFPLILANINQPVLMETRQAIYSRLKIGGTLLISGVLTENRVSLLKAYKELGLTLNYTKEKGEWSLLEFYK